MRPMPPFSRKFCSLRMSVDVTSCPLETNTVPPWSAALPEEPCRRGPAHRYRKSATAPGLYRHPALPEPEPFADRDPGAPATNGLRRRSGRAPQSLIGHRFVVVSGQHNQRGTRRSCVCGACSLSISRSRRTSSELSSTRRIRVGVSFIYSQAINSQTVGAVVVVPSIGVTNDHFGEDTASPSLAPLIGGIDRPL